MKALLTQTCQNLSKLPGSSEMHVVSKMKMLEANRRENDFVLIRTVNENLLEVGILL